MWGQFTGPLSQPASVGRTEARSDSVARTLAGSLSEPGRLLWKACATSGCKRNVRMESTLTPQVLDPAQRKAVLRRRVPQLRR